MSYKKLKDTWTIKEEYRNITGQFGLAPSEAQVFPAYSVGYNYPVVDSLVENQLQNATCTGGHMEQALGYDNKVLLGKCQLKNNGNIPEIIGVT